MTDVAYAVHVLTEPWTLVLSNDGYRAQDFPPRLEILQELVTPSNNSRGGGGLAHTRNPLDTKALDLLMQIQDVVGAWLFEWNTPLEQGQDTLVIRTMVFAKLLELRWRTGGIAESQYLSLSGSLVRWAEMIWELYEPPMRRPLRKAVCPACHRGKYTTDAGDEVDALVAMYGADGDPRVECQWGDCGTVWAGVETMKALGERLGATLDVDVLREFGYQRD